MANWKFFLPCAAILVSYLDVSHCQDNITIIPPTYPDGDLTTIHPSIVSLTKFNEDTFLRPPPPPDDIGDDPPLGTSTDANVNEEVFEPTILPNLSAPKIKYNVTTNLHSIEDANDAADTANKNVVDTSSNSTITEEDTETNATASIYEMISSSTLHKCLCQPNEVYYNGKCLQQKTFVLILENQIYWNETKVNTTDFGEVVVGKLNCPKDQLEFNLTYNQFYLLPNGYILYDEYNLLFNPQTSCVEHSIDEFGGLIWGAQVCLPPPIVNICCEAGSECSNDSHSEKFFPMVYVEGTDETWNYMPTEYLNIKCSKREKSETAVLGVDNYLIYTSQGVRLRVASELFYYETFGEFCIEKRKKKNKSENHFVAKFCSIDYQMERLETCSQNSCIRKCCEPNKILDGITGECLEVPEDKQWQIELFRNDTLEPIIDESEIYVWETGLPFCKRGSFTLTQSKDNKIKLLNNGSLYVDEYGTSMDPIDFCIDNFITDGETEEKALLCFPEESHVESRCQRVQSELYPSLLVVSCLFLIATLFVYAVIPELHAKVHGKSLVSHVFSLLVAYLCLVIVQWGSSLLSMQLCVIMGMLTQISFLGAFFWLNVMCLDIWWTLRSMKPVDENGESSRNRFKMYSIYAWGCPLIISIVTILMEFVPSSYSDMIIRPGFGIKKCWLQDNAALWAYFYGFVLALTISNIFFFCQVAFILIQAQRANNIILRTSSQQHKERVWLYLKLFVVMGVTWIWEVVSWQAGTCEPWLLADIINALQGLFIFIIFICKKNVYQKIRAKAAPQILHVKKIVRGTSSYNSSQTSQRTTQIEVSRSSRKLSTSLQPPGKVPMTVIVEDGGISSGRTRKPSVNLATTIPEGTAISRTDPPGASEAGSSRIEQSRTSGVRGPSRDNHRHLESMPSRSDQSRPAAPLETDVPVAAGKQSTKQSQAKPLDTVSSEVESVTISGPTTTIIPKK